MSSKKSKGGGLKGAPIRHTWRPSRLPLTPTSGWIGFCAAAPCSLLNDCHPQPVNADVQALLSSLLVFRLLARVFPITTCGANGLP